MLKAIQLPAVILCNPKYLHNVGEILRACSCFAVPTLMWTGNRVVIDKERGERLPREERMKGYADVTWFPHQRPVDWLPLGTHVVGIELLEGSEPLTNFEHYCIDGHAYNPGQVAYVFGPEDGSIPNGIRRLCHRFVNIPEHHCLNLSAAVNVVLADRMMKLQRAGVKPILPVGDMLHERRGLETPELTAMGWDGR